MTSCNWPAAATAAISVVDPNLWSNIPFKNRTAWRDFVGTHALWWESVCDEIFAVTGIAIRKYPIGDGGGPEWLEAVQDQYTAANEALGLAPPPDLASYDLTKAEEFASWTFLLSQSATQVRIAAGVA